MVGAVGISACSSRTISQPGARGVPAIDPSAMVAELIAAHNSVRAKAGMPELVVNPQLEAAAQRQARDMAGRRRMSHRGSDGSSPFRRMADAGYQFRSAAENVAMGQQTVDVLMGDWMRSRGHRHNILGNYTEIGAAGAIDRFGTPYWCVTFGEPLHREMASPGVAMRYP
jgi:uncharacterized protein YkwD